ncbi:MAG: type II toxin-antitoxin system VapC family toxin [Candidatus Entotheonellia bacterium]
MSSLSSLEDLAALPAGRHVFIDANIFIYHFTQTPLSASCTAFLRRVEVGNLQGTTSVVVLAEVAHRLMVLEAIASFGFPSRTAVKQLKEHPALVKQLTHYKVASEKIPAFNVTVEPITVGHLRLAQNLSATHGLLTNDSLTAAVMQTSALVDLASNDPDLSAVPGLTIWQPRLPPPVSSPARGEER